MPQALTDDQHAGRVQRMLDEAAPAGVPDRFTVEEVRAALAEAFDFWAAARADDPQDGRRPLWDLVMHDGDWDNAVFVMWVWDVDHVRIGCGMGVSGEVQDFCDGRAASEVDGLFEEARERFRMPADELTLPLADIERWIGRKW